MNVLCALCAYFCGLIVAKDMLLISRFYKAKKYRVQYFIIKFTVYEKESVKKGN